MKNYELTRREVNIDNNEILVVCIGEGVVAVEFAVVNSIPVCITDRRFVNTNDELSRILINDYKKRHELQQRIAELQHQLDTYSSLATEVEFIHFEDECDGVGGV